MNVAEGGQPIHHSTCSYLLADHEIPKKASMTIPENAWVKQRKKGTGVFHDHNRTGITNLHIFFEK
jgi:hypothetical protein